MKFLFKDVGTFDYSVPPPLIHDEEDMDLEVAHFKAPHLAITILRAIKMRAFR